MLSVPLGLPRKRKNLVTLDEVRAVEGGECTEGLRWQGDSRLSAEE